MSKDGGGDHQESKSFEEVLFKLSLKFVLDINAVRGDDQVPKVLRRLRRKECTIRRELPSTK